MLLLFLFLGKTSGDSVTQTEGLVTLSEGAALFLNCTYQTSYLSPYLFWYIQYPSKGPQILLKSVNDNQKVESQGFEATLIKRNSSFHLRKSTLQRSDSAVYYCVLSDTVRETTDATEHKPRGPQEACSWAALGGGSPSLPEAVFTQSSFKSMSLLQTKSLVSLGSHSLLCR